MAPETHSREETQREQTSEDQRRQFEKKFRLQRGDGVHRKYGVFRPQNGPLRRAVSFSLSASSSGEIKDHHQHQYPIAGHNQDVRYFCGGVVEEISSERSEIISAFQPWRRRG